MSRINLSTAIVAAVLTITTAPTFASNGFTPSNDDSGGEYHAMPGGKTRAEVIAELEAARRDGTLAKMSRNQSYVPGYDMPTRSVGTKRTKESSNVNISGSGELVFEAPATGGRTRAEVIEELRRAREDGSLRRMNTNRGY
ncbi:MAG: DUF4148 domain-containing protein [Gammaproteobacteria bacterium]|nr:DUF4148 domain-containing protein [Gammaproteobacteria bacterium]